jgi:hypothetical protein
MYHGLSWNMFALSDLDNVIIQLVQWHKTQASNGSCHPCLAKLWMVYSSTYEVCVGVPRGSVNGMFRSPMTFTFVQVANVAFPELKGESAGKPYAM